jgi:alpha-beta hydrolase superfamily lysophospholipase
VRARNCRARLPPRPTRAGPPPPGARRTTRHGGGFARLAALLNAAGYSAASFDLPAHGRSGSTHGLRGYDPDPMAWVDDLGTVFEHVKARLAPAGEPCFIYAEGASAALALHLLSPPRSSAGGGAGGGGAGAAGVALAGAPGGVAPAGFALRAPAAAAARWLAARLPAAPLPVPKWLTRRAFAAQFSDRSKGEAAFDTDE